MSVLIRSKTKIGWSAPEESRINTVFWVYVLPLVAILASAYGSNLARSNTTCATGGISDYDVYCTIGPFLGYGVIALAAIITLIAQGWRQNQSRKREDFRSKHLRRFNNKFKSVIDPPSDLFQSNHSDEDARKFIRAILNSGGNLFAHEDLRLSIYLLDAPEVSEDGSQQIMLKLVGCGGRGDNPRSGFYPGSSEGDWAIEAAKGSGAHAIVQVAPKDPRFNKLESSTWESFMAFPIRHDTNNLGILMIDSQSRTMWSYEDQAIGTTIAHIAAIGLNLLFPGATNTKPETGALRQALNQAHIAHHSNQVR